MNWRILLIGLAICFGLAGLAMFVDPTALFGNGTTFIETHWGAITVGRLALLILGGICAAAAFAMKG